MLLHMCPAHQTIPSEGWSPPEGSIPDQASTVTLSADQAMRRQFDHSRCLAAVLSSLQDVILGVHAEQVQHNIHGLLVASA